MTDVAWVQIGSSAVAVVAIIKLFSNEKYIRKLEQHKASKVDLETFEKEMRSTIKLYVPQERCRQCEKHWNFVNDTNEKQHERLEGKIEVVDKNMGEGFKTVNQGMQKLLERIP